MYRITMAVLVMLIVGGCAAPVETPHDFKGVYELPLRRVFCDTEYGVQYVEYLTGFNGHGGINGITVRLQRNGMPVPCEAHVR